MHLPPAYSNEIQRSVDPLKISSWPVNSFSSTQKSLLLQVPFASCSYLARSSWVPCFSLVSCTNSSVAAVIDLRNAQAWARWARASSRAREEPLVFLWSNVRVQVVALCGGRAFGRWTSPWQCTLCWVIFGCYRMQMVNECEKGEQSCYCRTLKSHEAMKPLIMTVCLDISRIQALEPVLSSPFRREFSATYTNVM